RPRRGEVAENRDDLIDLRPRENVGDVRPRTEQNESTLPRRQRARHANDDRDTDGRHELDLREVHDDGSLPHSREARQLQVHSVGALEVQAPFESNQTYSILQVRVLELHRTFLQIGGREYGELVKSACRSERSIAPSPQPSPRRGEGEDAGEKE